MRTHRGLILAGPALVTGPAAGAEQAEPLVFEDFTIHQYVGSRGFSPLSVMRLDNNDEILVACREPRTRDELTAMEVEFLESQIVLLRAMRMLASTDKGLVTRIPLLDAETTGALRSATALLAPELVAAVADEVKDLGAVLAEQGHEDHLYVILFSYILDGMAWDFFEEFGEVRPRRLTASSPHWAGEVWGTYPARDFTAGTSSILSGDLALKIGRSSRPGGPLEEALAQWRDLRELLRRLAEDDVAEDPELESWGLVGESGELAVPVVVEKPGEKVFELAQRVTEKVTAAALALDLEGLAAELKLRDREQTLIVTYHELMWDLMDAFEEKGLVARPRALAEPAAAEAADIGAVAFVVDSRRGDPVSRRDEEAKTDEE